MRESYSFKRLILMQGQFKKFTLTQSIVYNHLYDFYFK